MAMLQSTKKSVFNSKTNERGFSLVELMIALFVSSLVMSAVVAIYVAQSRSSSNHDGIANIQQNLRGALNILPLEIRLAGCDPTESKIPRILVATRSQLQFTRDIRGGAVDPNSADGEIDDPDENIMYGLTARDIVNQAVVIADNNGDGIVDSGGGNWNLGNNISSLGRRSGAVGGLIPLADNVEALEFNYILANGNTTLAPANVNDIRAVQVTLLARTENQASDFLHTGTYTTASGVVWTPPQDRFRRRLVLITIQCRNLGY